jgi:hypothetical protein
MDDQWVEAGDLQAGDRVRKADGGYGTVDTVVFVYQTQPMYNFTVGEAHTYFVGDGQWLVHNDCKPPVKFGYTDQLERFVGRIPGVSYLSSESWFPDLISREAMGHHSWKVRASEAMDVADQINFIIDGINLAAPDSSHWRTHWEMDQVISRGYTGKLDLWENGVKLGSVEAKQWIQKWRALRGL